MKDKYFKIIDNPKLKTSEILAKLKEKMTIWSYWDNTELDKYFPAPKSKTTRYFLKQIEPENLGKSANDVDPDGTKGITLREYALMHLQYFEETGNHLDVEGITICSGSRLPSGKVAVGRWGPSDSKVKFYWNFPERRNPSMGARLAVSLKPSSFNPSDSDLENRVKNLEEQMESLRKFLVF